MDRTGEHHLWTGARDAVRGTGRLKVGRKSITAHRHAWELAHGPLPTFARVLACPDEPACVRLDHLRVAGATEPARPTARAPKGAGSITQVRPGVWKLAVTAPAGVDGKARRVHRMVHVRNAREATDELASFVAEVRDAGGPSSEAASLHFDEAVERFLTEHLRDEKGREDNTIRSYRAVHHKWFPHIGSRLVRDIDEATLDRLFGRMRAAGLSRSSLNQAKSLYKPFFDWARKRGLNGRNPMAEFRLPTSTYVSPERTPPEVEELTCSRARSSDGPPEAQRAFLLVHADWVSAGGA